MHRLLPTWHHLCRRKPCSSYTVHQMCAVPPSSEAARFKHFEVQFKYEFVHQEDGKTHRGERANTLLEDNTNGEGQ